MQEGDFKVLQWQIQVICKSNRCIILLHHQRNRETGERVHEEATEPPRLQPRLGEDEELPSEGQQRGRDLQESHQHELKQNDAGSSRSHEQLRERMQLQWWLVA